MGQVRCARPGRDVCVECSGVEKVDRLPLSEAAPKWCSSPMMRSVQRLRGVASRTSASRHAIADHRRMTLRQRHSACPRPTALPGRVRESGGRNAPRCWKVLARRWHTRSRGVCAVVNEPCPTLTRAALSGVSGEAAQYPTRFGTFGSVTECRRDHPRSIGGRVPSHDDAGTLWDARGAAARL